MYSIPVDGATLEGHLAVPRGASGLVVFAHGSGSSRHSPRNNFVAETLRERGLGTLLFDLLTEAEDRRRENRFDVPLLTDRLVGVTRWVRERESAAGLPIGYFGASTGAAAALRGAARLPSDVDAVVSRGGRVDMAGEALDEVVAPTLLVVGGDDPEVLELNERADDRLDCETELYVVPGAGHLFEGPGELDAVADRAGEWFTRHLARLRH